MTQPAEPSIEQHAEPRISVIICAYNAGRYLARSLRSVLEQTHENLQVIVVDDGSTDGAVDALKRDCTDARVQWMRQSNAGKSVALNRALEQVHGEFFMIQDADDVSDPKRAELQAQRLREDQSLAAVFCGHDLILNGRRIAPRMRARNAEQCRRDIQAFRMPAHDPTVMYRTAMVRDIPFEPQLRIGQVFDHILRVGEQWPMQVLGACLYSYRVNWASATRRSPVTRQEYVRKVLKRACDRRGLQLEQVFPGLAQLRGASTDNNLAAHFMESALDLRRDSRFWEALRTGYQCMRLRPWSPHYHKAWIYALSPMALTSWLRRAA